MLCLNLLWETVNLGKCLIRFICSSVLFHRFWLHLQRCKVLIINWIIEHYFFLQIIYIYSVIFDMILVWWRFQAADGILVGACSSRNSPRHDAAAG